ncbi:hypothetical protein Salat_0227700 [Sesamum alatum]|uniref:Myb/SANT-like domain-containing protein n=1 Tax=Sesamum alatum TaxID=300844 RepID=A0AAE1Z070_9LAMI|nr:hypothetical protein Salat_0227700 [Sesamum alatum]
MANLNQNGAPRAAPPPPFVPHPQSHYFYNATWTRQHDHCFIQALYYEALKGQRQLSRTPNMHSLNYACRLVNVVFNFNFKYIVFKRRLERLRLWYNTFLTMLDTPGVVWDRQSDIILVEVNVWNNLVMELSCIFSMERPEQGSHGYIAISSDEGGSDGKNAVEVGGDDGSDGSTISD